MRVRAQGAGECLGRLRLPHPGLTLQQQRLRKPHGRMRGCGVAGSCWPSRPKPSRCSATWWTHAGQLVTKDALLTAMWPEIYVREGVLSECVREIRKALGDTPQALRFIETVHRRGYRFIGKVKSVASLFQLSTQSSVLSTLS